MYETVIWATDGSAGTDVALQEALRRTKIRRQVDELKRDGVDIDVVIRRSHCEAGAIEGAQGREDKKDEVGR